MTYLLGVLSVALLFSAVGYLLIRAKSVRAAGVQNGTSESGLTGVRFMAGRDVLESVRTSAAGLGWTVSRYDEQGRLVLTPPPGYRSEDFGRLLEGIEPYKHQIDGLQVLGPHGGPVDSDGIELVDQR